MKRSNHQRGQALVIIVFALIGLIALTALAIDGGNVYSDRRHAQNAADTAALAAGLARVRQSASAPVNAWKDAGWGVAAENGYPQAGPNSTVNIDPCTSATCPELPTQVKAADGSMVAIDYTQFVKVSITSIVHTYFAPIVGISTLTNQVDAIVRATPPTVNTWYGGNALVATMPGCKDSNWNHDPFKLSGSEVSLVNGSGVFVNSNCSDAFTASNNTSLSAPDGGICVVGGADPNGADLNPAPTHDCSQIDPATYQLDPSEYVSICNSEGAGHINNGIASPGNYSSLTWNSGGTLKLMRGVYCLNSTHNALTINGGVVTTDIDGDGIGASPRDDSEGVLFYIPNGDVDISGNAELHISAMEGPSNLDYHLKGYLIVLPVTNTNTVSIQGGGASQVVGSITAPASHVQLSGGSSTGTGTDVFTLQTQIVGYSIEVTGSGELNITYLADKIGKTYTNPQLIPYK